MGYASFDLDDGAGPRGYAVPDICRHSGCQERINRGMAYLCYGCAKYFCEKHLTGSYDKDDDPIEFDCYAGVDSQCCFRCAQEVYDEARAQTGWRAWLRRAFAL